MAHIPGDKVARPGIDGEVRIDGHGVERRGAVGLGEGERAQAITLWERDTDYNSDVADKWVPADVPDHHIARTGKAAGRGRGQRRSGARCEERRDLRPPRLVGVVPPEGDGV